LTKKSLRNVIGKILGDTDFPTTVKFLDDMKNLGYMNAFKAVFLSLADIVVPEKRK
jgi:DNA-directed RNA polymerase subunit beta'